MSDKILKLNQAQTLYNDLRERIEALPTDNDIPTKISDLIDDSGHYTKPAEGIPASDLSEEIVSTIDGKAPAIYCEKSGAIVSFDDGAGNMPLKDCVVQIEPVQEGTGDPSPENVRPITGWTGAKVTKTGKNLIDTTGSTLVGSTVLIGTDSVNTFNYFLKAGTYTLSEKWQNNGYAYWRRKGTTDINIIHGSNAHSGTFTLPADDWYRFWYYKNGSINLSDITEIMLEVGSTATDYEPYQGDTYDITFPAEAGTVYGGQDKIISGELKRTLIMYEYDGSDDENWTRNPGRNGYAIDTADQIASDLTGFACNMFVLRTNSSGTGIYVLNARTSIFAQNVFDIANTVADWRAWLSEHHLQVVLPLAEPIVYQLTPHEISTLLGTNNIWADTGDTAVTYPADTKMFVEQNTPESPVQDVQVNGTSIVTDGVANVPIASGTKAGAVIVSDNGAFGVSMRSGRLLGITKATDARIKAGIYEFQPIVASNQHLSAFYGLAKAAGDTTQSQSSNSVGDYTDNAKEKIQSMLGITQMLAPTNPNLVASQAYSIGDVFAANGHLYKATVAIAQDEAIIPDTNCVETTMADAGGKIKDVQVAGTSVVGSDGVANIPKATSSTLGLVKGNTSYGTTIESNGMIQLVQVTDAQIKEGTQYYRPITAAKQHMSTFYGLSKVAGVDLANETVTLGTYPETSKTAIKAMLGVQDGLKVVRLI